MLSHAASFPVSTHDEIGLCTFLSSSLSRVGAPLAASNPHAFIAHWKAHQMFDGGSFPTLQASASDQKGAIDPNIEAQLVKFVGAILGRA